MEIRAPAIRGTPGCRPVHLCSANSVAPRSAPADVEIRASSVARLTIFARLNVPAFLQGLADFPLRQMRLRGPIFRHPRRFAVLGDKFCWVHVFRFPIEI